MPRMNHVKAARPAKGGRACEVCRKPIEVGESYIHWSFRYGGKHCVHTGACRAKLPRSATTSNDRFGRLWDLQDNTESEMAGATVDELQSLGEAAAEEIREVAQEYRDSADAIREHFQESPKADECEERADEIEGWADEIEAAASEVGTEIEDRVEEGEEHDEDDAAFTDRMREQAAEPLGNCPV